MRNHSTAQHDRRIKSCCEGACGASLRKQRQMKAMQALLVMTLAVAAVVAFPASNVTAGKCSVGSNDLCSCSQLIAKKIIKGLDDCTQEVAIAACKDGKCSNDFAVSTGEAREKSPR